MKSVIFSIIIFALAFAKDINYGTITNNFEIIRVYDGDTFYINVKDWPAIVGSNIAIRVFGIDTPEKRTKNLKEKILAHKATKIVERAFKKAKKIELRNCLRGKYFRIVAEVWIDGVDLAEILIKEGLAYRYDGGTKDPPWK